jgi:hypothetical protein
VYQTLHYTPLIHTTFASVYQLKVKKKNKKIEILSEHDILVDVTKTFLWVIRIDNFSHVL